MNLTDEKKQPLRLKRVEEKRAMLAMQFKGTMQVRGGGRESRTISLGATINHGGARITWGVQEIIMGTPELSVGRQN